MDTTKALDPKALDAAGKAYATFTDHYSAEGLKRAIRAYLTTLAEQGEAAQRAEAVAWRWRYSNKGPWQYTENQPSSGLYDGMEHEPLFLASPPAPLPDALHVPEHGGTWLDGGKTFVPDAPAAALAAKEAECEALRKERDAWKAVAEQQSDSIDLVERKARHWMAQAEAAETKLKRIRAETIEECAKVADCDCDSYCDRKEAAEAIRALTDEPQT